MKLPITIKALVGIWSIGAITDLVVLIATLKTLSNQLIAIGTGKCLVEICCIALFFLPRSWYWHFFAGTFTVGFLLRLIHLSAVGVPTDDMLRLALLLNLVMSALGIAFILMPISKVYFKGAPKSAKVD